ncbi:phosphoribosylformylglycinamidine synthase subunit PurL [Thermosyntropha sp.]|uniref:phosphoribosylformylglycinamidine synthase subunit PurL n=1 Tax=Thermosyntropha sp. TaxID=2740820 RepID=UPI0025FCC419|nr:phosphoribosylformylglycinamidine synthase subunit PurL [Thermosyntropha sp.]MBO8158303.1 phosphoribosylformylglycinamidine synthase subunit PurL [Thermosyntropha sp.]
MKNNMSYRDLGIGDDEYRMILDFMGREPNELELGMFSVMWSEHCGYKNSRPLLKLFPTKGEHVIQGPGENAGVIDIGDNDALVFKIESHNHPSAIEPYQGAATGVGGIVRDIFTMGARPVALLNSLRFGEPYDERVKELLAGVVAGIGDYGNCLGIPTVGGEIYFNDCYKENPLVNAMCIGLVKKDEIKRAVASRIGSPIMLVGAKTGRDGIHGATFASEELSEESTAKRPAVQVGDPFMEKLLIEACLELIKEDLIDGMQDLGAAGLVSSVAETASKEGCGVVIDVLKVPRREEGMTPYEVMLSESQERMLVIPKEGKEKRIAEIFDKWGLDAVVIGQVTDDGIFRVFEGEKEVAAVPVVALTEGCPVYVREGIKPDYYRKVQGLNEDELLSVNLTEAFKKLLASPNIASKKWVFSQYDYQVMTNTVVVPGDGDAAVLRIKGTKKGFAASTDCNSRMVYLNPYEGGMMTVCEAARNLACVGAKPLALTNCLNFGNPEKPEIYWQFKEAVKGMAKAAEFLGTPVVSGNVSLYNESSNGAVYPTPVVGMVGLLEDIENRRDMAFKNEGDIICLLGRLRRELGGSEYLYVCHGMESGRVPEVDLEEEKSLINLLLELTSLKVLSSCHDISEGGLAVALAESAIKGGIGFSVKLESLDAGILFSEAPTRAVVSLNKDNISKLKEVSSKWGIEVHVLGRTGGEEIIIAGEENEAVSLNLEEARQIWGERLQCLMK